MLDQLQELRKLEQEVMTSAEKSRPKRDPRDQAIVDERKRQVGGSGMMQELAELEGEVILEERQNARAYAEKAPPEMVAKTRAVLENITNASNRFGAIEALRAMSPEEQEEVMRLAPGVMQQLGDDRGNIAWRALNSLWKGTNEGIINPTSELLGGFGLTPKEIETAKYLEGLRAQDAGPQRPDDPWYTRGPLQALEMAPWSIQAASAGGVGRSVATRVAGNLAGRAATGSKAAQAIVGAGNRVGNLSTKIGLPKLTAGKAGELAGITAASYPAMYIGEYDELKDMGMEDGVALRGLAGLSAVVGGLIEGIVPNPFPEANVSLKHGAMKAVRQYMKEAIKKYPGELSEEGFQGLSAGVFQHLAQYIDENVEERSLKDAVLQGIEDVKESALPMAFLMGVPAGGKAGLSAVQARKETQQFREMAANLTPDQTQQAIQRLMELSTIRSKGFVSEEDAKAAGIGGENRKERLANVDEEIYDLKAMAEIALESSRETIVEEADGSEVMPTDTAATTEILTEEGVPDEVRQQDAQEQASQDQFDPTERETVVEEIRVPTQEEIADLEAEALAEIERERAGSSPQAVDGKAVESAEVETPAVEAQESAPKAPDAESAPIATDTQTEATAATQDAPAPTVEQPAKQPWEMTREEWVKNRGAQAPMESDEFVAKHLADVPTGKPGIAVEGDKIVYRSDNGEPIGVTTLRTAGGEKVVDNTAVHPQHRRQGIATKLYEKAGELGHNTGWVENEVSAAVKHKSAIQKALTEGKSVPAEVLAEYPDIMRDSAVSRLKTETGYVVTPREAANDAESEQLDFLKSRGKQASFVDAKDKRFTGAVDERTGFMLISGNRKTDDIWRTIGHELAHETGLDTIIPADAAELSKFGARRLARAHGKYKQRLESDPDLLNREARADMIGQFMRDKSFRDKLSRENPTMWEQLRDAILKLVGKWTPKNEAQAKVLEELRKTKETGSERKRTGRKAKPTEAREGAETATPEASSDARADAEPVPSELSETADRAGELSIDEFADIFANPEATAQAPKKAKEPEFPKKPRSIRKDAKKGVEEGLKEAKEGADLIRKGLKDLGNTAFTGPPINADIARGMGMMANGLIKAGKYKFAEFIDAAVEMIGASAVKYLGPYLEAGWNKKAESDSRLDKAVNVAEYLDKPVDYGTEESPNRVALGRYFETQLADGKRYERITQARNEAGELIGGKIEPGTQAAKAVDEAVEQGVVRVARSIVAGERTKLEKFDKLLDLYERQPRLATRTGTSMREQAFSTPAPLAYIASILTDTEPGMVVYDSSAGNGMLLIGTDAQNAIANEINPDRAEALRELGYTVNQGDGTKYTPGKVDRVIINPPFGELDNQTWTIGGVKTNLIDHAIVMKSLESLPENGKAVLIIGAKGFEKRQPKGEIERGQAYANQKPFYDHVYNNYNVTDHFTVHGDMYAKQGASFPVDVIVIDGRGQSKLPKPNEIDRQNAVPRVIDSWKELRNVAERHLDTGVGRPSDLRTERTNDGMAGLQELLEGQDSRTRRSGRKPRPDNRKRDGVSRRGDVDNQSARGPDGQPGISESTETAPSTELEQVSNEGQTDGTGRGRDDAPGLARADIPVEQDAETEFQVTYTKQSKLDGVGTLVPRTQAAAVEKALEIAEERYGDLDEFVANELGYESSELGRHFSAEQVDALALNIARHKEGKAFVLGDATGVGKGRVAAGMMVYAKRQGLVPVFITQGPSLYADMYRDLTDIGRHSLEKPFHALATNTLSGQEAIALPDGSTLKQSADFAKDTIMALAQSVSRGEGPVADVVAEVTTDKNGKPLGKTKAGKQRVRKVKEKREYDAIFTTYKQMQTQKGKLAERHNALQMISPNAFFILDESHNAGGSTDANKSSTADEKLSAARMIRGMLDEAKGASFLSATYAKRVQVMDLYAKTGIAESIEGGPDALIETLVTGGVPLQQVLSEMLVESGAYMRRERSFDGVSFDINVKDTGLEEAGEVANMFNAINDLDRVKREIVSTDRFKKWLVSQGLGVGKDSATGTRGMDSTAFSSIMHNLVDQMLLSIKADATADAAIESLKRGESPVIAVSNTMGAAFDNYLAENPVNIGDEIDFRFNTMASRYLERSREVMLFEKGADGKKRFQQIRIPDELLGDVGVSAYNAAKELVDNFAANLPASPIDHIRHKLEQAGYTVAEITGRDKMVDYADGKMRFIQRPSAEMSDSGKIRTVSKFNSGQIDVMILNQSGSTGLSAHASAKFKNTKRRNMIIAQADKNIDTFMQMLGRIHRTGQIAEHPGQPKGSNLPRYTLLMSNVPAETRPASVLKKKLASLNANVTADAEGSVSFDVPDIFNSVGDRIVAEYLVEHPELNNALEPDGLVEIKRDGTPRPFPGVASKASGRMAMRPIQEQQDFWSAVEQAFNDEIANLNALGKNPLQAAKLDLGAEVLERVKIFDGDPNADSPFLQPAFAERMRVKKQGEPHKPAEIQKALQDVYSKQPTQQDIVQWVRDQYELIDADAERALDARLSRMRDPEAIANLREDIRNRVNSAKNAIYRLAPGKMVYVSEGGDVDSAVSGVVMSLKPAKGKAHTMSGWTAVISIASPDRVLRVPLTRVDTDANETQPGELSVQSSGSVIDSSSMSEWEQGADAYEERVVGTGNILAAFDQLIGGDQRVNGSIVFFTDKDGKSQRGVLMSRSFKMDKWQEQRPAIFKTEGQVLEFLNMNSDHQVESPDFSIQLTMDNGVLVVRSPKSRQRSGKYTANQDIITASGTDFVSVGTIMQMKVSDRKAQKATIAAILKVGPLSTGLNKELARQIISPETDTTAKDDLADGLDGMTGTLYQREESSKDILKEAAAVAVKAENAGITTYDEFVAFAVDKIGERRTRMLGAYLQVVGKAAGMKGVRPTKDILGVPGVTRDQAVAFATAAFPMLSAEQIEAGIELQDVTGFGRDQVGFAPADTPVPGGQQQEKDGNIKGWTQFISATRAIIGATDKADVSTFIHEFFHPMRRFLLDRSIPQEKRAGITDGDIQALEDYAGVKDGKWTEAAEEKAAKAWEAYWYKGESPNTLLNSLFEKIARWMKDIYSSIQQITNNELTPEVRALFDKIVQRGFPDGMKQPPPYDKPGAAPPNDPSHPEKAERILPNRHEYTALAREIVDYLRDLDGVPGLESTTPQTIKEWVEKAEITIAADPDAPARLFRELKSNRGRAIDHHEGMLLAFHERKLANDVAAADREAKEAAESGDPERIAMARTKFIQTRQPQTDFENLVYSSLSTWGRMGIVAQVMLRKDFTYAGLMRRAQTANHGKELDKDQKKEIEKLAKKIEDLQKLVDEATARAERAEAEIASKKQHDEVVKTSKPKPPVRTKPPRGTAPDKASALGRLKSFLDAIAESTGFNTLFQRDNPYEGAVNVYRELGVTTFAELNRHIQERFGMEAAAKLKDEFKQAWKATSPEIDLKGVVGVGDPAMTKLARQIQREVVESGITERLEVLEAVREELSQMLEEEVTEIQAMDALSGYGQYSLPSQEGIEPLLRQLNSEHLKARQILQLEETLARADELRAQNPEWTEQQIGDQLVKEDLMVKPTGPQRDAPEKELRDLHRKYSELKSQVPVSTENREGMLQTTLGAIQKALANRIIDLNAAIDNKEPINNQRRPSPTSPDIEKQRAEVARLTKIYREMFPRKPLSEEQKIRNAVRAAERSIAEMEKQIATHNFDKPKSMKVWSPELEALQAEKDAMRSRIEALKALELSRWDSEGGALAPDPRDTAMRRAYLASVERRIAEYKRQIANNDFEPKKKQKRVLSPEELKAQRRLADARLEAIDAMVRYHVANLKGVEWGIDKLKEISHFTRALMASMDASALLNQGALFALGRPKMAAKVMIEISSSLWQTFNKDKLLNKNEFTLEKVEEFLLGIDSRQAEFELIEKITSGEWGEFKIKAGLEVTSSDQELKHQEEAFQGRWGRWFPGIAVSGRVHSMVLNKIRSDMFDTLANSLPLAGKPTLEEAKLIAHFVNVATGRSDFKGVPFLDWFEKNSATLNTVFFATRFFMSRIQYAAMPLYMPFAGGGLLKHKNVKLAIAAEMARSMIGFGAVIGSVALAAFLFWDEDDEDRPTIGTDSTSSDFLKVKVGDTRLDFAGGLQQAIVLASRLGQQRIGDRPFGEGYNSNNSLTVLTKFVRTKLAPVPGYVITGLNNWEDVVGQTQTDVMGIETHPSIATAANMFFPLSWNDIADTMREQGAGPGTFMSALALLGVRVSTYGEKTEYMNSTEEKRGEMREKYLKRMTWDSPDPGFKEFLTPEQYDEFQARREQRKQSLVNQALADPDRSNFKTDENYEEAVARRDAAIKAIREAGWTSTEIRQLLLDYWKANHGSTRQVKDGMPVLKDAVRNRLRQINKQFGSVGRLEN